MPPAYSPEVDLAMPTGRKPAAVTRVPVSMGKAVEVQAKVAAFMRDQPASSFTTMVSTAMMASSTRRPRERMRAPSEMRWSSMPISSITTKTAASVRGTARATTTPTRRPSEAKETRRTTPRATTNLKRNSPTASPMTSGWSAICWSSMPRGRSARMRAICVARSWPNCSPLVPLRIAAAMTTAEWPLWRISDWGGSA